MDTVQGEMMAFYRETASLEDGGGWRAVGNAIGKSGAYARQLATGKRPVTKKVATAWAAKSGWVCKTVSVPVCPIHGVVHDAGPCATDKPVAAVVVLAPGETVRRPGQPRYRARYWRPCMPATLTPKQKAKLMEMAKILEGQRE